MREREEVQEVPWGQLVPGVWGGAGGGRSGEGAAGGGGGGGKPAKIKPNEKCPCGSGKKYKKCHGAN